MYFKDKETNCYCRCVSVQYNSRKGNVQSLHVIVIKYFFFFTFNGDMGCRVVFNLVVTLIKFPCGEVNTIDNMMTLRLHICIQKAAG